MYKSQDYDTEHLITLLQGLKARHPHLRIILEPGSAFTWQTGVLTSDVVDIVESRGIKTAILNVSFTCHMPDCLEMPYPVSYTHLHFRTGLILMEESWLNDNFAECPERA